MSIDTEMEKFIPPEEVLFVKKGITSSIMGSCYVLDPTRFGDIFKNYKGRVLPGFPFPAGGLTDEARLIAGDIFCFHDRDDELLGVLRNTTSDDIRNIVINNRDPVAKGFTLGTTMKHVENTNKTGETQAALNTIAKICAQEQFLLGFNEGISIDYQALLTTLYISYRTSLYPDFF